MLHLIETRLFWYMAYSTRNITFEARFLWFMAYRTRIVTFEARLTGNQTNSSDRERSGRGLQKKLSAGSHKYSVICGDWVKKENNMGDNFAVCLINFSQIFDILWTLAAREL